MAITKVTNRVLENSSVGIAQLSAGAVPNKLGSEIGPFAFRNKLINGNFNFWQRGTSFTNQANLAYSADRWSNVYNNGGTRNVTRQPFTPGQTEVPGNPGFFLSFNQTVAGSTGAGIFNSLVQKIESVATLASKQVVVTFWAKANAPITVNVGAAQFFGTGGSPSPQVSTNFGNFSLTTTWQKFTGFITLPSIVNKQLGNINTDFLQLSFNCPTNSVFTFDIAQVQLEEGSYATPFEERPIGTELALCQRYYQSNWYVGNIRFNGSSVPVPPVVSLNPPMRAIPTIRITNGARFGTEATWIARQMELIDYVTQPSSTPNISTSTQVGPGTSEKSFGFQFTSAANATDIVRFFWTADAEL